MGKNNGTTEQMLPAQQLPIPGEQSVAGKEQEPQTLNLTDVGNSYRFARDWFQEIRFDHSSGRWLMWEDGRWNPSENFRVTELAKESVRRIAEEAERGRWGDLQDWAKQSESASRIANMINLARSVEPIAVTGRELDANPWLLNVENGTLDLSTISFRNHDKNDLLTKLAPVLYDRDADAPFWRDFLDKIFCGNKALIESVQQCLGYSLTGVVSEHKLFFCYGTGANGKTTLLEGFSAIMGDYAQRAPSEMLMLKPWDGIPADVARLKGARFVVTSELAGQRSFNEARIKDLTGGDTITARFLYQNPFEFSPTHKLWIAGNHKPRIDGTDHGIWRRIFLIPFNWTIPEKERLSMHVVQEKIMAEKSGILNWALEGLEQYNAHGLGEPPEVRAATEAYRAEMDVVGGFIDQCCVVDEDARISFKELYVGYQKHCQESSNPPLAYRDFNARVREKGIRESRMTGGAYRWEGISLSGGVNE